MVNTHYETVLSSQVVGDLQNYALNTEYQPIVQKYHGEVYQSVSAHRLPKAQREAYRKAGGREIFEKYNKELNRMEYFDQYGNKLGNKEDNGTYGNADMKYYGPGGEHIAANE